VRSFFLEPAQKSEESFILCSFRTGTLDARANCPRVRVAQVVRDLCGDRRFFPKSRLAKGATPPSPKMSRSGAHAASPLVAQSFLAVRSSLKLKTQAQSRSTNTHASPEHYRAARVAETLSPQRQCRVAPGSTVIPGCALFHSSLKPKLKLGPGRPRSC
jgi:hypothetical protein